MPDSVIVSTKLGDLLGKCYVTLQGESIFCFLGVPYAKPPIGELRFKAPVPLIPWNGVRIAHTSPQVSAALIPYTKDAPQLIPNCSEDSLYLNIYTPMVPKPGLRLPVMVYIHGGGFTFGSSNKEVLGPDFLVPQGIILVTINYRVGPLGFLSLYTKECPGNYGLKDQTMGLQWVKNNIEAFGGDKDNVTLFGESAGAASVHYHLLSPLSRGLFQRAIVQSGCALNRWAVSRYPRQSAVLLAKRIGCQSDDLDEIFTFLQNAKLEEILINSRGVFGEVEGVWSFDSVIDMGFVPTVEPTDTPNAFITMHPEKMVESGLYANVPVIAGCCSHEAIFALPSADFTPPYKNDEDFQRLLPKELGLSLGSEKMLRASKMLKDFYFSNGVNQKGYIEACTALHFTYGLFKFVEAHSKNPEKTTPDYLYLLTGGRSEPTVKQLLGLTSVPGTCHAEDLDFLFTGVQGLCSKNPIKIDSKEHRIQKLLIKLWTDFAKNGIASPDWPPTNADNEFSYAELSESISIKKRFIADEIDLWNKIYSVLKN